MRAANQRAAVSASSNEDDISLWPLSKWRARWADKDIQRLFIENFIYVIDAFDDSKLKLLKFNDVQVKLHYSRTRKNAILKARKQGVSTYWQALFFSTCVVLSGREFRSVPHEPDIEEKFQATFKVMYENLAMHLRPATRYYSAELIHFNDPLKGTINSRITTSTPQPGHEGKGRGDSINLLHITEIPYWRGDAKKTAASILEAAQQGEIAAESTANGIEYFHSIYTQGKRGKGGWKSFFFEWWWKRDYRLDGARFELGRKREWVLLMPGETLKDVWQVPAGELTEAQRAAKRNRFDQAKVTEVELAIAKKVLAHLKAFGYAKKSDIWQSSEVAAYIAWRRQKIDALEGGAAEFAVEYPENDEDCFENTGNPVIKPKDCKVTCLPSGPKDGRSYLIGCDTSRGYSHGDPMAIEIIDLYSGRQVHSEELRLKPDGLAYRLVELSDLYNFAVMAVERNNTGVAVLQELRKLVPDQERIYKELTKRLLRKVEDGEITYDEAMEECDFGIETTSSNKGLMGSYIERAVRKGEIGLSSQEWVDQAKTVVWFDNGSWGAMSGYHDDRFIALAIANYVRETKMSQVGGYGVEVMPAFGDAR